jgi:hypothetical protein
LIKELGPIGELAASVMRHSLIIIPILVGLNSYAQWRPDTTISKKTLDSLHHELVRYKDAAKQTYFNQIVIGNTITVDSLFTVDKGTLTITKRIKDYSENKKSILTRKDAKAG